jgi:hypothetical protein
VGLAYDAGVADPELIPVELKAFPAPPGVHGISGATGGLGAESEKTGAESVAPPVQSGGSAAEVDPSAGVSPG